VPGGLGLAKPSNLVMRAGPGGPLGKSRLPNKLSFGSFAEVNTVLSKSQLVNSCQYCLDKSATSGFFLKSWMRKTSAKVEIA
jgi:hypothetical protein